MNNISRKDWQYFIPFLLIAGIFLCSDFISLLNKLNFAYNSRTITFEPYRAITSHFFHADFRHLIANTFGIVIARYFLKELNLKGNICKTKSNFYAKARL